MDVTQRKSALESMYQIVLRRHCSLITHNQVGVTSTVLNMKKSNAGHQRTEINFLGWLSYIGVFYDSCQYPNFLREDGKRSLNRKHADVGLNTPIKHDAENTC